MFEFELPRLWFVANCAIFFTAPNLLKILGQHLESVVQHVVLGALHNLIKKYWWFGLGIIHCISTWLSTCPTNSSFSSLCLAFVVIFERRYLLCTSGTNLEGNNTYLGTLLVGLNLYHSHTSRQTEEGRCCSCLKVSASSCSSSSPSWLLTIGR